MPELGLNSKFKLLGRSDEIVNKVKRVVTDSESYVKCEKIKTKLTNKKCYKVAQKRYSIFQINIE